MFSVGNTPPKDLTATHQNGLSVITEPLWRGFPQERECEAMHVSREPCLCPRNGQLPALFPPEEPAVGFSTQGQHSGPDLCPELMPEEVL